MQTPIGIADAAIVFHVEQTEVLLPEGLKKPTRDAAVLVELGNGLSTRQAAEAVGTSKATAGRLHKNHVTWIEGQRERVAVKVLRRLGAPIRARVRDASDETSKTGAQSFRGLLEACGIVGKHGGGTSIHVGDVHVHGDIDARSIHLPDGDLAAARTAAAAARAELDL